MADHPSESPSSTSQPEAKPEPKPKAKPSQGKRPTRPRRLTREEGFRFPWIVFSLWVVAAVLLTAGWYFRSEYDSALFSLAFVICVGLSSIVTFFWFVFFSGLSAWFRYLVGLSVVAAIAVAAYTFNVERVDFGGAMVPTRMQFDLGKKSLVVTTQPTVRFTMVKYEKLGEVKVEEADVLLAGFDNRAFPAFLGPGGQNHLSQTELSEDWSESPSQLWKIPIGEGWSGFAAKNGYAVTLEQRGENEYVTCYRIADGSAVWATPTKARHENDVLGGIGPRSTPTISEDGLVYAAGATGILRCLKGSDGKVVWEVNLLELAGTDAKTDRQIVAWGRSNSPLVVDDLCILPLGGRQGESTTLVAFDRKTGDVIWKRGSEQISYATPVLLELYHVPQIVITNENSVSSHDLQTGEELWKFPWSGSSSSSASVSNPVALPGNKILISKGYGVGAAVFQINFENGEWSAKELWSGHVLRTKFTNPVVHDGYAYGLSDGILECVNLEDGKRMWKKGRYGHGQTLGVGQHLLVMGESGEVALVRLNPDAFEEVATFSALEGKTWNNPCLYGDKLLVRNAEEARCYQLPVVSMPKPNVAPDDATPEADPGSAERNEVEMGESPMNEAGAPEEATSDATED